MSADEQAQQVRLIIQACAIKQWSLILLDMEARSLAPKDREACARDLLNCE